MAPRSPSGSGSRVIMPAALLAMQRNVPTRLIWMIRLNDSVGKLRISPELRSRLAVRIALPVPAQLTRMRSWPLAALALANAASTSSSEVTLQAQNTPPPSSFKSAFAFSSCRGKSKIAIFTPLAASWRTVASPRPDAPPVTTAEMVLSSFMASKASVWLGSSSPLAPLGAGRKRHATLGPPAAGGDRGEEGERRPGVGLEERERPRRIVEPQADRLGEQDGGENGEERQCGEAEPGHPPGARRQPNRDDVEAEHRTRGRRAQPER